MYRGLRVGAVIVAAGKGKRMDAGINKQYINIGSRPVLAHTLLVFDDIDLIDNLVVVVGTDEIDYCNKNIINKYCVKKIVNVVAGGRERQHSVVNGLNALKDICDIVVTHDGARPLVTASLIEKSIEEACVYGAAACAVPVKDTIKVIDSSMFITSTPDREKLYAVQTPQTFMFDLLYKAHISAVEENFIGTDDTVLVERIGTRVKLFKGSYENIKITTPEDIFLAEAIIRYRNSRQENS